MLLQLSQWSLGQCMGSGKNVLLSASGTESIMIHFQSNSMAEDLQDEHDFLTAQVTSPATSPLYM